MKNQRKWQTKTLAVAAVGVLLVTGVVCGIGWKRHARDDHFRQHLADVGAYYQTELDRHLVEVSTHIDEVIENESICAAWTAREREALLEASLPLYRRLESEFSITHFYFHDKQGVNWLRVHEPLRHGDRIDRWTMREAMTTGAAAGGVELGPLGTLTVRYVQPWIIDSELVGYVELGLEVGHVVQEVQEKLAIDAVLLVRKDLLDRKGWERGQRLLGRVPRWDREPDMVVVCHTFAHLPHAIVEKLHQRDGNATGSPFSIRIGERKRTAGFLPLADARDASVGELLILCQL